MNLRYTKMDENFIRRPVVSFVEPLHRFTQIVIFYPCFFLSVFPSSVAIFAGVITL